MLKKAKKGVDFEYFFHFKNFISRSCHYLSISKAFHNFSPKMDISQCEENRPKCHFLGFLEDLATL